MKAIPNHVINNKSLILSKYCISPSEALSLGRVLLVCLALLGLALLAIPTPQASAEEVAKATTGVQQHIKLDSEKRILFLSSYSFSWDSVPKQIAGIKHELTGDYIINYMFMDTKNTVYSPNYQEFYESIKFKLQQRDPYDAVIVGDDAALNFVMLHKDEFFPKTPIVFEGIDDVENALAAAKDPYITGLTEQADYVSNILLARRLYPKATKLTFLIDDSENGIGIYKQLQSYRNLSQGLEVGFIRSSDYTKEDFLKELSKIDYDTICFCIAIGKTKSGKVYTQEERYSILEKYVHVPLFSITQSRLSNSPYFGGKIVNHEECGRRAGKMVKDILTGTSPNAIPVELETPSYYSFNYNTMLKYGISPDVLPVSTVYVNKPQSFLDKYHQQLLYSLGALILLVLALTLHIKSKTKMNYIAYSEALDQKNLVLQKAANEKNDFLTRMSHDIRTPMNAVIGLSGLGLEESAEAKAKDYFQKINFSGSYLLGLMNDILDMSRIEAGSIELNEEFTPAIHFCDNIKVLLIPLLNERNITLNIDYPDVGDLQLYFDRLRLKQIYVNLLSNAIKYSPKGSSILWTVTLLEERDGYLTYTSTIKDQGCGMSQEFLQRIFTPFARERNPYSDETNSSGLGLAICKNLLTHMGGTIAVKSTLGQGSEFSLTLRQRLHRPTTQEIAQEATIQDFAGKQVLLVEDHPLNAMIAKRILEKRNLRVTCAKDGQQGVLAFQNSAPYFYSAILMDIRMPNMNGLEATSAIRALPREDARLVPIIALTANAYESDRQASQKAGMNAHLAKPINPQELYTTLAEYILKPLGAFIVTGLILLSLLGLPLTAAAAFEPLSHPTHHSTIPDKRILIISSYSFSWGTVPKQLEGILSQLDDNYIINYEFMDTKNTVYSKGYKEFYKLLKYRLASRGKYDLVIVGDDAALGFAKLYGQELFPQVPIVFEGIDNVENGLATAKASPYITGIVEQVDYKANIDIIHRLMPKAKKILFILDRAENGIGIEAQLKKSSSVFEDYQVSYLNSTDYTKEELVQRLAAIDSDTIVFCITMSQSKDGAIYTEEERHALLTKYARVPLFRVSQAGVGEGPFVGGYVVDHYQCGIVAGQMAKRILEGTSPSAIPVEQNTPQISYFNSALLEKYGLDAGVLPQGTTLLNQKPTLLQLHYQAFIWLFGFICLFLLLVLLYYTIHNTRQYAAYNKALEEKNKKLQETNQYKTDFLARLSHDMRTPMNAVIGMANLGLEDCREELALSYFTKIKESAEYLLQLLNSILNSSSKAAEQTTNLSAIADPLPAHELVPVDKIDLTGLRLLLVEDHPINIEVAQKLLAKKGAQVTIARDGLAGLEAFRASEVNYYSLILMDIQMPLMDGVEATKAIRALPRADATTIPIVALTGNVHSKELQDYLRAGMNGRAVKPLIPIDFYNIILQLTKK